MNFLSSPSVNVSCAICYADNLQENDIVVMPCCGKSTSTVQYCLACITQLKHVSEPNISKCPSCTTKFALIAGTNQVISSNHLKKCRMCCQGRVLINETRLCEPCDAGGRKPLRYECSGCHQVQRIPHPMWKYQPSLAEYSTDTWACHQQCGTQTRWRVVEADIKCQTNHLYK